MSNDKKGREPLRNEDTEAILRRRRFLIESALAGLGVGALAAGCKEEPEPKVCLTALPPEPPPKKGTGPQVCLRPAPPPKGDTKAQPCLEVAPTPAPCLSVPANPQPCLEVMPPKEAPPKERPQACLSIDIRK